MIDWETGGRTGGTVTPIPNRHSERETQEGGERFSDLPDTHGHTDTDTQRQSDSRTNAPEIYGEVRDKKTVGEIERAVEWGTDSVRIHGRSG